jgi:hypothetical protein
MSSSDPDQGTLEQTALHLPVRIRDLDASSWINHEQQ